MRPDMQQRLLPPSGPPQIETVALAQYQDATVRYMERGFARIGIASFSGPPGTREQAIEQAQKVGAEFVLIGSEYSRSAQVSIPSLSVQPGQTFTTQEHGNITGNTFQGGTTAYNYGTYSGSATTTTFPTFQTQYTPVDVPIYSQVATFWRRAKPPIFGAQFAPLPEDIRAKLERNTGVLVAAIIEGSPAFRANIIRGDVITQFGDTPIDTVQNLLDATRANAGQRIPVTIIRGTRTLTIEVQLNSVTPLQ